MVFCATCGAEITANEKFCKYCGSEIEIPAATAARSAAPPVAPAPSAAPQASAGAKAKRPKKKMKKIGIVVLVLLGITGASYGILIAATWGTYDQTIPFAYYSSGADYDNITLNVHVSLAGINISYIDPVDGAPLVQGVYEQHLVGSKIGEFKFTNSSSGNTVNLDMTPAILLFPASFYCRVNIQLLKNTSYTILAEADTGNVLLVGTDVKETLDVRASASTGNVNVTFTNVNVTGSLITSTSTGNNAVTLTRCNVTGNAHSHASTGNLAVTFTDTHVEGNFEFSASTGNAGLLFTNLTIDNDAPSFWANCSTGNLDVEFQQRVDLGGIMGTYLETSTGSVHLYYKAVSGLDTGFKGVGSASTGSVTVHPEIPFSSGAGNTIQTANYDTKTWKINALNVKASTGSVDIYATSLA